MGSSRHDGFGPASSLRCIGVPTDDRFIDEFTKGCLELFHNLKTLGLSGVVERTNHAGNAQPFVHPCADTINETPENG